MTALSAPPEPAALWRRIGAFVYDLLLLAALWFLGTALLLPLTGGEAIPQHGPWRWLYSLWLLGIALVFYLGFWVRAGQTLGMRAWGIAIVDARDGQSPPNLTQAARRFAGGLLSLMSGGIGLLWALGDAQRRAWPDRLSQTLTVRRRLRDHATGH